MKGPGLRNDLEIRRTWMCPLCGRIAKHLGHVVALTCSCSNNPVQMKLQPDIRKAPPKFEKVVIPLTEEDLIVRERPRRMPEPPEEGAELDRRPMRPKRPKPERRSFESFQEQLGTAEPHVNSDTPAPEEMLASDSHQDRTPLAAIPPEKKPTEAKPPHVEDDGFGEGLA